MPKIILDFEWREDNRTPVIGGYQAEVSNPGSWKYVIRDLNGNVAKMGFTFSQTDARKRAVVLLKNFLLGNTT